MIRTVFVLALLFVAHRVVGSLSNTVSSQKCKKVVDIAMVVDESGSIGRVNFNKIKSFLADMVSHFSVTPFGAHFGVVKYSTNPQLVFSLTKYTNVAQIQNEIRKMSYRGGMTRTGKALDYTRKHVLGQSQDRKDVPNVLVLFSDGESHDHSVAKRVTDEMKRNGVAVLCVGIGKGTVSSRLMKQLQELASKPEYVFKTAINALKTIEDSLVKDVCEAVDPCSTKPCKNGGTCSRNGDSYTCKCTPNFEGKNCELPKGQKCKKVVDIAMVVDESGSIGRVNFNKIKLFLADMVSHFSVTPFGAHFGVVKYSTNPQLVFSLTKYTNAAQIQNEIRKMSYRGGMTRTGKALDYTRKHVLGQSQDRKDVPNILVLFSDGASHDHAVAKRVTDEMKRNGVAVLCVGIGKGTVSSRLVKQLQELASKPEYVFKTAINALKTIENSLVKDVCEAVDPCSTKPCKNGGTCLRDGDSYTCKCTPDFEGRNCEVPKGQKCKKVVDIAMVVDESGSIGRVNFNKIKSFLTDMVSHFSVTPFGAHFGVVKYSTYPQLVFSLTKYTNAAQIQNEIRKMSYRGGMTRTGKALDYTRKHVLGQSQDRKDVPNVLVLFSDGASQDHSVAKKVTDEMKLNGVAVVCVGIGKGTVSSHLVKQLQELASKPEYVFKTAINALKTIEDSLVKDVCEAVDPCSTKPCDNGGTCIRDGDSYTCKCTPDYEGQNCELPKWCPAASFKKQGCYKMPIVKKPEQLLFNRRHVIDWGTGWDAFIEKLVCDCGAEAKRKGYRYFCIEFYGECWGYNQFDVAKPHANPDKCWGKRPKFDMCMHEQKNPICVGTNFHGYIYKLD